MFNRGMNKTYTNKQCAQFVRDMDKARIDVEHYRGRNFCEGPASVCASISDVMSKTSVPCQYDNMGKSFIVYPKVSDKGIETQPN